MPGSQTTKPDDFFTAEFGTSDLASRLWRGGLRADPKGYACLSGSRVLSNALREGLDVRVTDGAVEALINEIETCWNDTARLRRACNVIRGGESRQATALSVSLAKLALSVDLLQPAMVTCVVNKISEFGEADNGDGDVASVLLNQLRWLDFIVDGPALCESLLSIVPVVSPLVQRTLIEALPEILDDTSREAAVTELVRLLEDCPSMMGSVVDALGALGVDDGRLVDVNTSILSALPAANRDMLPVSLKYLLRTCPPTLLTETVRALRHTLALPGLGPGPGRLCLDAVRTGLRMRKIMADHVLKVLRGIEKPSDHKPADFWILVALLDSPVHRKQAEVLFRKKAAKNAFSKAVIDAALAPFADAFGGLTDRLIAIASMAVQSSELGARRTGVLLYGLLFRLFSAGNTRRNVVTALLDHTGTRRSQEMDAALEALVVIAKESENDRALLPHSASIQGLLDFMEFFSDSQLRQIWTILGFLCRASSPEAKRLRTEKAGSHQKRAEKKWSDTAEVVDDSDDDDDDDDDEGEAELAMLEILLRKELTHADNFYRRIGVLGACTMIKVLGGRVRNNILGMLLDVGRAHPQSQALAFDELANVFEEEDAESKETAESIRKTIANLFERKYITDRAGLGSLVKDEQLLSAQLFGNLEGEDVEFCISVSLLIREERTLQESQDAVRAMAPNLRLLCAMTARHYDGSLTEVDAIIGAPLHLPLMPKAEEFGTLAARAKGDLLLSLFAARNWVVELLNGFAGQESTEIRAKCVMRVDNLLTLTDQISTCVSQIPLWREVLFDAYSRTTESLRNHSGLPKRKYRKGAQGGRVAHLGKAVNGIASKGKDWERLARQVSPSAISLIRITTPITWRFTETETETEFDRVGEPVTQKIVLSSKGLSYLLSELAHHTDSVVAGEYQNAGAFSVTLFRPSVGCSTTAVKHSPISDATTDGRLNRLVALRTSLTALGAQLRHFRGKLLSTDEEDAEDEDSSVEMYRNCAELCLRSLAVSLNSKLLADPSAEELLFSVLASVRLDGNSEVEASDPLTSADIHIAAKEAFGQLRQMLKDVVGVEEMDADNAHRYKCASEVGLRVCCALLAGMEAVFLHCSEKDQAKLSSEFSESAWWLLGHRWGVATLRVRATQKLLPGIIKIYVQQAQDAFKTAEVLREQVVKLSKKQESLAKKKIGTQDVDGTPDVDPETPGSLTEQTCNAYTVAILEQYLWLFKCFQPRTYEDATQAFAHLENFIKAELPLYTLARTNQCMLGPVMRAGRSFVDMFLKSCVPFLKDSFRDHRGSVVQICKMHQKPTRLLQTFCAHSKYMRDSSLTGLVPPLRKSLELLLYRVKELLQAHNATDAFELGNLKHRDINGEVLGSQHLQYKSTSEDESEYDSEPGTAEEGDEDDAERAEHAKGTRMTKGSSMSKTSSRKSQGKVGGRREKEKKHTTAATTAAAKGKEAEAEAEAEVNVGRAESFALDFGSDVDSEASRLDDREAVKDREAVGRDEEEEEEEEEEEDEIKVVRGGKKERRKRAAAQSKKTRRAHPLIDDEAAGSGEEEDDDDVGDLSQFLVFGDEEEEEE